MPPSTVHAFTKAARSRLLSAHAAALPHLPVLFYLDGAEPMPTAELYDIWRTRGLCTALGWASPASAFSPRSYARLWDSDGRPMARPRIR
jgi:hypothetical protein